jgi:hypothetical protein
MAPRPSHALAAALLCAGMAACQRDAGAVEVALTADEAECGLSIVEGHPDGHVLLHEFLDRDAAGRFLESDDWFDNATECPDHEPGPDAFRVISSWHIVDSTFTDTSGRAVIESQQLGRVSSDSLDDKVFEPDPRTYIDTVEVRLTRFGWRVRSPALRQLVRAPAPVLDSMLTPKQRAKLAAVSNH